jgi:hypothetical protein
MSRSAADVLSASPRDERVVRELRTRRPPLIEQSPSNRAQAQSLFTQFQRC